MSLNNEKKSVKVDVSKIYLIFSLIVSFLTCIVLFNELSNNERSRKNEYISDATQIAQLMYNVRSMEDDIKELDDIVKLNEKTTVTHSAVIGSINEKLVDIQVTLKDWEKYKK